MKRSILTALLVTLLSSCCWADVVFASLTQTVNASVDEEKVEAFYKFENKGDAPILIKKIHSVCPWCLSGELSGGKKSAKGFEFQPGEKGVLRATFKMGTFVGTVEKEIHLYVDNDAEDQPSVKLKCKVVIPEMIKLQPKSLSWKLSERGVTKKVLISVETTSQIMIFPPTCTSKEFNLKFIELEKGRKYECLITPKADAKKQIALSYFKTDSKHVKYRRFRCYLKVIP